MFQENFINEDPAPHEESALSGKIKALGLTPDNEEQAMLVAEGTIPYSELEFHQGADHALKQVKALEELGLYVLIEDPSDFSAKIMIFNNEEDYQQHRSERL